MTSIWFNYCTCWLVSILKCKRWICNTKRQLSSDRFLSFDISRDWTMYFCFSCPMISWRQPFLYSSSILSHHLRLCTRMLLLPSRKYSPLKSREEGLRKWNLYLVSDNSGPCNQALHYCLITMLRLLNCGPLVLRILDQMLDNLLLFTSVWPKLTLKLVLDLS